jgi:hypothetical protein
MEGQTDRQMDGWIDGHTDGCAKGLTDKQIDRCFPSILTKIAC